MVQERKERLNSNRIQAWASILSCALPLLLSGCAGDFVDPNNVFTINSDKINTQGTVEKTLTGARIRLNHLDFYTLSSPNDFGCAGDVRTYYSSIYGSQAQPVALNSDFFDSDATVKPAFIKNVSVDLTDSNATGSTNLAFSCSYGTGDGVSPSSNCATFDYGAIGGVPTNLGGSLFVFGGIEGQNFANDPTSVGLSPTLACGPLKDATLITDTDGESDVNRCPAEVYAVAIDTLPASVATDPPSDLAPNLTSATEPISSYLNLSSEDDYVGPRGGAGSTTAYNVESNEVLLFSGSAPLDGSDVTNEGYESNDTWVYNVKTQTWTKVPSLLNTDNEIKNMSDCQTATASSCTSTTLKKVNRNIGGHALFGYTTAQGLSTLSLTSGTGQVLAANEDPTDRIIVVGGFNGDDVDDAEVVSQNIWKINPTFGPELVNMQGRAGTDNEEYVTQWAEANPVQLMNSTIAAHLLTYEAAGAATLFNVEAVGAYNITGTGAANEGYVMIAGGFDGDEVVTGATSGGNFQITLRDGGLSDDYAHEYAFLPTYSIFDFYSLQEEGLEVHPVVWTQATENAGTQTIPDFGGMAFVKGIDIDSADDIEVAMFGGVNCRSYMLENSGAGTCHDSGATAVSFNTASRYWDFGNGVPSATLATLAADSAISGDVPAKAGMAVAHGLDGGDAQIVVAWGGTHSDLASSTEDYIYYMYSNAGTPTFVRVTPPAPRPVPAINSTLVYSHVTDKYYLFGGLETDPDLENSGDTWELSISGTCTTAGTCDFTWRQLDPTCSPDCSGPNPRRSHRMLEVNYNNTTPLGTYSSCTETSGCSFGIFMEGGTADGISVFSDRWMFDPTANGGLGHWVRVNDFPPRSLAASASISYFVPSLGKRVHKTIVYGGQLGLHSPEETTASAQVFVPPTFADTLMYDHEAKQWDRVDILGMGLNDENDDWAPTSDTTNPQQVARQMYDADYANEPRTLLHELSPPPLAGAVMVARTLPSATVGTSTTIEPLKIPQIFLFGGREKDGDYLNFASMYKFCAASTGEDYTNTNAHCDAFDETDNPNSPSPSKRAEGRWLRKKPYDVSAQVTDGVDPTGLYSFMGAATYDPHNDLVLVMGGLAPGAGKTKVTEVDRTILGVSGSNFSLYEYHPPTTSLVPGNGGTSDTGGLTAAQQQAIHGYWTQVHPCDNTNAPSGTYGHSLHFDALNGQVILYGGYDSSDNPLVQDWQFDGDAGGTDITIPQLWVAERKQTAAISGATATTAFCYDWRNIDTFGTLLDSENTQIPNFNGLAHAGTAYIPAAGYNTGYYAMFDDSCIGQGPFVSPDEGTSSDFAGGIDIDIDRDQLCKNEQLLLTFTYLPLGDKNLQPDLQPFEKSEEGIFEIQLVRTGLNEALIQQTFQPRYLAYFDSDAYPKVVHRFAVLSDPTGGVRTEQFLLPIHMDAGIDRVRILRRTGSAIAIDASIHRMGCR